MHWRRAVLEVRTNRETVLSFSLLLQVWMGGRELMRWRCECESGVGRKLGEWGASCWRRFPALVARRDGLLAVRACRAPTGVHIYDFLMRYRGR